MCCHFSEKPSDAISTINLFEEEHTRHIMKQCETYTITPLKLKTLRSLCLLLPTKW